MIKYSVIVPVYNAERYLDKCVSSILQQTAVDFELILVDDGSSDSSLQKCLEFAESDARVRVLHQENAGVSAARNAGLREANGSYILFVDADDFVSDDYFATIERYSGEYDLLEFGHYDYLMDKSGGFIRSEPSKMCCKLEMRSPLCWKELFLNTFFASPCNKVFRRELLAGILFDETCVCYEDYLFNLAYCERIKSYRVTDSPIYSYRQSVVINPVTKRRWGKRFEISRKVARDTKEFIANHRESPDISALNAYPYGAFLTELRAAKETGADELAAASKQAVREELFLDVLTDFPNAGHRINLLALLIRMRLYNLAAFWLRKMVV